jgi:hypothetical protein
MPELSYKSDENVKTGQFILTVDGLSVAYANNAQLTITTDPVDTSNKMDGMWKSAKAGKKSWAINSEAMLTEQAGTESYDALIKAQIVGDPIAVVFGTLKGTVDPTTGAMSAVAIDTTMPSYKGNIIITSNEIQSQSGDLAKHTMQAQGSSPLLTVGAVPAT